MKIDINSLLANSLVQLKKFYSNKPRFFLVSALILILMFGSWPFGLISTGNVGVRTTFKQINEDEIGPGIYLNIPFISKVVEFTTKEIPIDLDDLTPKAKDNLSLRDLDVSVYYKVSPNKVADLSIKYEDFSIANGNGELIPAESLVSKIARNSIYEESSKIDSLVMHTQREVLASAIQSAMQAELDKNDPATFKITRVVVRSILTDSAVEKAIQEAVSSQKRLDAMSIQTEIAKKEAEIKVTEAHGVAEAQKIIAGSLTKEYLQHESNLALLEFARKGGSNTVVLQAGIPATPLINLSK